MRRFIALSLSFLILVNCIDMQSSASFIIKPTMSPDSGDIVKVSYIPPTQQNMPYFNDAMSSFCIGLIKFELKNPQNFMPNVKVRVKVAPPPSMCRIMWNKFKSMVWPPFKTLGLVLLGEAVGVILGCWKYNVNIRENIMDFIVGRPTESNAIINGGALLGLTGSFLLSDGGGGDSIFKMTINGTSFEHSLAPISEQEAKTLQKNKVRPGEKKEGKKEYDKHYEEIQAVNGPTIGESIAQMTLERGYDAYFDPDVDYYDPLGLLAKADFRKLDEYRCHRDFKNYVNDKESKIANLQNAMKKRQFCKNHSDDKEGINISNYSNEILATLSRDNPVQYGAIMVNNPVEAAKLRKLLERSYSATSQLSYRLSISFSAEIISSLPEGSESDEETERKAEIALGTGPSWPARIVRPFLPYFFAKCGSGLVDFIWKSIYSGGAWACDKIKSKFLIEKDPAWVIPQDDNPSWVVPEVEPGVDPPWAIPPKADPWYKRGWDKVKRGWNKVKSWFSFEIDSNDINLAGTLPSSLDNLANMPPQFQQNQNNRQQQEDQQQQNHQEQPQNPYNNNIPNYYDSSAANGQAQQAQNNQQQQEDQQQQNHQATPSAQQQQAQQDTNNNGNNNICGFPISTLQSWGVLSSNDNESNENVVSTQSSSNVSEASEAGESETNSDDNNNNSKADTSSIDKNDNDWEEPPPVIGIDINAIPQRKNRTGNSPRNSTQSAFKTGD